MSGSSRISRLVHIAQKRAPGLDPKVCSGLGTTACTKTKTSGASHESVQTRRALSGNEETPYVSCNAAEPPQPRFRRLLACRHCPLPWREGLGKRCRRGDRLCGRQVRLNEHRACDSAATGHVGALRSKEVAYAIAGGLVGCIAITYIQWSSVGRLQTVLPWTTICDSGQAAAAASTIDRAGDTGQGRSSRGRTSLSFAIDVSGQLLDRFPGTARKNIIDVSSNGTNNDGLPVTESRRRAVTSSMQSQWSELSLALPPTFPATSGRMSSAGQDHSSSLPHHPPTIRSPFAESSFWRSAALLQGMIARPGSRSRCLFSGYLWIIRLRRRISKSCDDRRRPS